MLHKRVLIFEFRTCFNVPARRKFLKKPTTEFGHIEEIVRRLALTHFDIRFVLEHNDNIRINLPIADSGELRFQRVQQLLGQQFVQNAYWIDAESINMRLSGWLGILQMHVPKQTYNMCM